MHILADPFGKTWVVAATSFKIQYSACGDRVGSFRIFKNLSFYNSRHYKIILRYHIVVFSISVSMICT